jgi:hypothetical protein
VRDPQNDPRARRKRQEAAFLAPGPAPVRSEVVEVDVVTLASEFPNDNPALHRGVIWVCLHPLAAATPEGAIETAPPELREADAVAVADAVADADADADADAVAVAEAVAEAVADADADADADAVAVAVAVALAPPDAPSASAPAALALVPAVSSAPEAELTAALDEAVIHVAPARPSGIIAIPRHVIPETFAIEDDRDEDDQDDDLVIEDLEPVAEIVLEGSTPPPVESAVALIPEREAVANDVVAESTALPPAPDEPFTVLLCTLADVAVSAGSPYVASVLPALLLEGTLDASTPADARQALTDAGIVVGDAVTDAFATKTRAWRALLDGTSDDFDACGGAMLDEWAADLLARLLGAPSRMENLRRDLRSRGVAAFGLAA